MKSIRLSLLVYFLGLLAAALGVASLLAYRTAQRTLAEKKEKAEELVEAKYTDRCRETNEQLDKDLLFQAQTLARLAQFQIDWGRVRLGQFQHEWKQLGELRKLHLLGLLSSNVSPNGFALAHVWAAGGGDNVFNLNPMQPQPPQIKLNQNDLLHHLDEQIAEYFQIDSVWGSSYRSQKLGQRSLPLDPRTFAPDQVFHIEYDNFQLAPDLTVRRVMLKSGSSRLMRNRGLGSGRPRPGPDARPPRGGVGGGERPGPREGGGRRPPQPPAVFIQCACNPHKLEATLLQFRNDRDGERAAIDADTLASLAGLRNRLWLISTITFAATVLGCFWLVRLGLMPLHRLSDAVSRVSPRDFRLPLEQRRLPAELQPIVARLEEMLGQLKRAFAREKQATADISHELRTPLAALLTTIELALRKPRPAEQYREMLQECQLSAQQMNTAVERLLTLARLDAGVDVLRPRAVDVAQLAEQCATMVRPLAEARGLSLHVHARPAPEARPGDGDEGAVPATTDPDKLREVLTNLLHNAIQYNRPQGSIDVTVGRTNGLLDLEVRDTGIGIAPEARELIFERFYRADPSRGTDGLHAGLGLAIVKEYVGLMGGSIEVESAEGRGSTFRVQLPTRPPSPN